MRNIAIGVIISIGLIVSTISYCFLMRYQITTVDGIPMSYKIDRITGKTWVCFPRAMLGYKYPGCHPIKNHR